MRRIPIAVCAAVVVCAALVVAVAATAALPLAAAAVRPDPARLGAVIGNVRHQTDPSPCVVTHTKTASPDVLLLGETATITLTAKSSCPDESLALHVVLVLDGSGSMAGAKSPQMKQAAAQLIRGLDMPTYPSTMVGVVEFNTQARRLCSLTSEENRAISCVNRVGANGGSRMDLAIMEGLRVLSLHRQGLNRDELTEVMVVLSDGGNNAGCAPVLSAVQSARGQGVLVIAVCVGDDCDETCMRQVASSPRYFFKAENAGQLVSVIQRIRDSALGISLRKLTVHDALPEWMEFVPDSADPPQTSPVAPDRWLEWEETYVSADGVTYTFEVKPLKTGYMPTNTEATGDLIDHKARSRSWVFQVPWVTVLNPGTPPIPTATAIPPTSTPTPSPTATPTPSATAAPGPRTAYLPWAVRPE